MVRPVAAVWKNEGGILGYMMRCLCWWIAVLLLARPGMTQGRTRLSGPVVEFSVGGRRMGLIADYGSIQEAVDAAPEGGAVIRVREGVYREAVRVAKRGVRLLGEGKVVVVFGGRCAEVCRATLTVTGDDFFAQGITVENDVPGPGAAGAVEVSGDRAVLREVRMLGAVRVGTKACGGRARCGVARQYFAGCVVEGGSVTGEGRAVFAGCDLGSVGGVGAAEGGGLVFDHCVLDGAGPVAVGPGVVWLHTEMRVGLVARTQPGAALYAEFGSSGMYAGKGALLSQGEARGFAAGVFLRGEDGWVAETVR